MYSKKILSPTVHWTPQTSVWQRPSISFQESALSSHSCRQKGENEQSSPRHCSLLFLCDVHLSQEGRASRANRLLRVEPLKASAQEVYVLTWILELDTNPDITPPTLRSGPFTARPSGSAIHVEFWSSWPLRLPYGQPGFATLGFVSLNSCFTSLPYSFPMVKWSIRNFFQWTQNELL